MTNRGTADDEAARKARAEAIRRARDARNTGGGTPATEVPPAGAETGAETAREPNYVDLIDRKMREMETD
jgi:hypothetical protein